MKGRVSQNFDLGLSFHFSSFHVEVHICFKCHKVIRFKWANKTKENALVILLRKILLISNAT